MPKIDKHKTSVCPACGKSNQNPLNPIGRAIVRRLAERGMTVAELKKALGPAGGLYKGMHGGNLTLPTLERVAKVLKTTPSALIADSEKKGKR